MQPPFAEKVMKLQPALFILLLVDCKEVPMVRRIASISPLVLAGGILMRLAGIAVVQYFIGLNGTELWHHWLMQLLIGG
jgi:hypothetical protein